MKCQKCNNFIRSGNQEVNEKGRETRKKKKLDEANMEGTEEEKNNNEIKGKT